MKSAQSNLSCLHHSTSGPQQPSRRRPFLQPPSLQRMIEPYIEGQTTKHLDLLEEVREQASIRAASYQNRTAKHFNSRVRTRRFRVGDLVLRKAAAAGHPPGKLGTAWEGPYEVIRKVREGAYSLRDTFWKSLPKPWNTSNLKIYYK